MLNEDYHYSNNKKLKRTGNMYCQGFGTFKCCKPNINFNNCFAKPLSNMNI